MNDLKKSFLVKHDVNFYIWPQVVDFSYSFSRILEFIPLYYKFVLLLMYFENILWLRFVFFWFKAFYRVKTENSSFTALYNFLIKKCFLVEFRMKSLFKVFCSPTTTLFIKDLDRGLIEKISPFRCCWKACSNIFKLALFL